MPDLTHSEKREILAKPVKYFADTHPDASSEQLATIKALGEEYTEIKKQHKTCSKRCRRISRQIGEAKRAQMPVAELMQDMKTSSSKLKDLEQKLSDISDSILNSVVPVMAHRVVDESLPTHAESCNSDVEEDGEQSDGTGFEVRLLQDEDNAWNRYVDSCPAASIYHRAEWRHLVRNVFGHEGYYLYAKDSHNKITGILPLVRLKSRLFGDFMISMPYFNYGGALADCRSIEDMLMQYANSLARDLGTNHIEYRDETPRDGYPVKTGKVNMILALPDTRDELWSSFTSKLRAQIRRPQRENTLVQCGGEELLNAFYSVFARNMRDLGTPVYGKSFFRNILKLFPKQSRIIIVHLESRPVAAAFLLGYKDMLQIPWASTIRDVNHLSINMLLYWEVLKFATDNSFNYFDFGRSSKESGTYRFKQQWGAKPKQLFWHYWLANATELPELNPENPKYVLAINIWKQLPISVTKWLGPFIVKNLP